MQKHQAETVVAHFLSGLQLTTIRFRKRIYIQITHSVVLKLVPSFFDDYYDGDISKTIAIEIGEHVYRLADHSNGGFDLAANLLSDEIAELFGFDSDITRSILAQDERKILLRACGGSGSATTSDK